MVPLANLISSLVNRYGHWDNVPQELKDQLSGYFEEGVGWVDGPSGQALQIDALMQAMYEKIHSGDLALAGTPDYAGGIGGDHFNDPYNLLPVEARRPAYHGETMYVSTEDEERYGSEGGGGGLTLNNGTSVADIMERMRTKFPLHYEWFQKFPLEIEIAEFGLFQLQSVRREPNAEVYTIQLDPDQSEFEAFSKLLRIVTNPKVESGGETFDDYFERRLGELGIDPRPLGLEPGPGDPNYHAYQMEKKRKWVAAIHQSMKDRGATEEEISAADRTRVWGEFFGPGGQFDQTIVMMAPMAARSIAAQGRMGMQPPSLAMPPRQWSGMPGRESVQIGHTTPWERMTPAQRKAFQHSYTRHARELGLPTWSQRNAESLRQQFNDIVGYVRENGTPISTPPKKLFKGKRVEVKFYEATFHGVRYYYYETLDGIFISAGRLR